MSWVARKKLNTAHTIAVIVVLGCLTLMAMGKDGVVHTTLLTVIVFYFGKSAEMPAGRGTSPTPKRVAELDEDGSMP